MKKYLVIGNPIEHSLSPKLHNYWIKKNNIDAVYDKKQLNKVDIDNIILEVKSGKIDGINVTVPFKQSVIPFLDELSPEANESQSVNTIYKENDKVIGHNTDIAGFELGLRHFKYDVKDKKVFILGSGGVVSSIILALKKMGTSKIFYILLAAAICSGCGLENMAKRYETISLTTTPPVLETHGGEVALSLNATFAKNYFDKKACKK